MFTAVTAGFLVLGYHALRAAETPQAWHARRRARRAYKAARLARAKADRDEAERDRLLEAYLVHVRRLALKVCPGERQMAVQSAVRQHLLGRLPLAEGEAWADPARFEQGLYPSSSFSPEAASVTDESPTVGQPGRETHSGSKVAKR